MDTSRVVLSHENVRDFADPVKCNDLRERDPVTYEFLERFTEGPLEWGVWHYTDGRDTTPVRSNGFWRRIKRLFSKRVE